MDLRSRTDNKEKLLMLKAEIMEKSDESESMVRASHEIKSLSEHNQFAMRESAKEYQDTITRLKKRVEQL